MIFKQWAQVLDGTKTQTRRPVKKHGQVLTPSSLHTERSFPFPPSVLENSRVKWQVGCTYAVQPGRGKKSVGRIRITKIRREKLQKIAGHFDDIRAEGVEKDILDTSYEWLMRWVKLWNSAYRSPYRWDDNPDVWVLDFELAEG